MENKIREYLDRAKRNYEEVKNKPERYRKEAELEKAEAVLITIECLCLELGLIQEGTI